MNYRKAKILIALTFSFATLLFSGCAGRDFMPDYFGMGEEGEPASVGEGLPSEGSAEEEVPSGIEIYKLIVGMDGGQIEIPIPSGDTLEIGTGTFIAQNETDVGPKFTASAKFKIANNGDTPCEVSLPNQIGPFFFSSLGGLAEQLAPGQSIIITITFHPSADLIGDSGRISEEIGIGGKTFIVTGIAVEPSGLVTVNVIDGEGGLLLSDASSLEFDEIALSAHSLKRYFRCNRIPCSGEIKYTSCSPCTDIAGGNCRLLAVNDYGEPVDEVDRSCRPVAADRQPAQEINLAATDIITTKVSKKIIEVMNTGTEPLFINSITVAETESSKSQGQFSVNEGALFIGDTFEEVKSGILTAFDTGGAAESAELPIVLPPYDPPIINTRLFLVVAYHPDDIAGSDGASASVGSSSKDEAILEFMLDEGPHQLSLAGTTAIEEVPALQVYLKTSTGLRPVNNNDVVPFKGITVSTEDLAIPLFMKLSDSAGSGLRISGISLNGANFEWLDTAEKIEEKPEGVRCTVPVLDDSGSQIDIITDLNPVSLSPDGFTLESGIYTTNNMPLFGCINFHRDTEAAIETPAFEAEMTITAQEITTDGRPAVNPDGSLKETLLTFSVLGVIDPLKGKIILRLTQTMAIIMNPQFPGVASAAASDEMDVMIANGLAVEEDRDLFISAIHLDPFDEDTIYSMDGSVASLPGDGLTAVFYPVDTRAVPVKYDDPYLPDYTNLIHDSLLPEGQQGIFTGYPNLPEDLKTPGLKIFTSSLSYPGPIAPPEERPEEPSRCEVIDPCTAEGQRRLSEGPSNPSYRGVCAFFYVTAGNTNSPAFHYPTEDPPGIRRDMCTDRDTPYKLNSVKGRYYLDGKMEFDNMSMLFQGPTYFHNPSGPLGPVTPLEERLDLTFTTETLLPFSETKDINRIPDKRIDIARGEYRINLNDPYSDLPQFCENNVDNRYVMGKYYSTWKYLASLLKKDREGTRPAGCPEPDNNFTGGIAYLSGKRLDQTTGHASFVSVSKFSSSDNLTFAFKDVVIFIVLNGWFCDPLGPEEEMEGVHCFDKAFNYRDAATQYSTMGGTR